MDTRLPISLAISQGVIPAIHQETKSNEILFTRPSLAFLYSLKHAGSLVLLYMHRIGLGG